MSSNVIYYMFLMIYVSQMPHRRPLLYIVSVKMAKEVVDNCLIFPLLLSTTSRFYVLMLCKLSII